MCLAVEVMCEITRFRLVRSTGFVASSSEGIIPRLNCGLRWVSKKSYLFLRADARWFLGHVAQTLRDDFYAGVFNSRIRQRFEIVTANLSGPQIDIDSRGRFSPLTIRTTLRLC